MVIMIMIMIMMMTMIIIILINIIIIITIFHSPITRDYGINDSFLSALALAEVHNVWMRRSGWGTSLTRLRALVPRHMLDTSHTGTPNLDG
jgi:hypothetical protein